MSHPQQQTWTAGTDSNILAAVCIIDGMRLKVGPSNL